MEGMKNPGPGSFWFLNESKNLEWQLNALQNKLAKAREKNRSRRYVTVAYQIYGTAHDPRYWPMARSRFTTLKAAIGWCGKIALNISTPKNTGRFRQANDRPIYTAIYIWNEQAEEYVLYIGSEEQV